jgi:solute carrier family 10 (sodium/bile acid cotransporter), member 7
MLGEGQTPFETEPNFRSNILVANTTEPVGKPLEPPVVKPQNLQLAVAARIANNWFLIGLAIVLCFGMFLHEPLKILAQVGGIQSSVVFVVMWMMAVPVPFALVRGALARPWPAILASMLNMGLLPLLALVAGQLLNSDLAGGLIVAAVIPCTLASAAVFTRKAGGDDAVVIFVTLITNVSCALITPLWIVTLLGQSIQLDLTSLILSLCWLVLLPILLAQAMRMVPTIATAANARKLLLGTLCQIGILIMVLLGSIQMGQRLASGDAAALSLPQIVLVVLVCSATHLFALYIGWVSAGLTGLQRPQKIAVALAGSQKTLMIGLKLAIDCGVSILPMIVFHVSQLVLDSLLVERWKAAVPSSSVDEKKQTSANR